MSQNFSIFAVIIHANIRFVTSFPVVLTQKVYGNISKLHCWRIQYNEYKVAYATYVRCKNCLRTESFSTPFFHFFPSYLSIFFFSLLLSLFLPFLLRFLSFSILFLFSHCQFGCAFLSARSRHRRNGNGSTSRQKNTGNVPCVQRKMECGANETSLHIWIHDDDELLNCHKWNIAISRWMRFREEKKMWWVFVLWNIETFEVWAIFAIAIWCS